MDDEDDLAIDGVLDTNKSIREEIEIDELRKLGADSKSKFNWTEMNRDSLDMHDHKSYYLSQQKNSK